MSTGARSGKRGEPGFARSVQIDTRHPIEQCSQSLGHSLGKPNLPHFVFPLAECPPIRVTRAEISRRDPMLELARRMKAGAFKDSVDQACESTVEFHRRKLKFIIDSPGGRDIADRELCLLFGFKDRKDLEKLKSEIGI